MAFIVETGQGFTEANSYISILEADAYFLERGNTRWAAMNFDQKQQALINATDYMTGKYRGRWKGTRTHLNQALDWPRAGVVIEDVAGGLARYGGGYGLAEVAYDGIPIEVKRACAELAIRASIKALVKDQKQAKLSVSVGPVSVSYDRDSPVQAVYTQVDMMLRPYLQSLGGMVKLGRR